MRSAGKKNRSPSKGKIAVLCVLAVIVLAITLVMTDCIPPYTSIAKGFVEIGIDYISLDRADEKQSKANVQAALENAKSHVSHPFVLATQEEFDAVKKSVLAGENGNEKVNTYYEYTKYYADLLLLDEPACAPLTYELDEEDAILEISRETLERVIALGLVWKVTDDDQYASRAWEELENVCNFADWCPSHFLDVAEMSLAVAVGYDWFFDWLNDEQKQTLSQAFIEKGLKPASSKNLLKYWWSWSKTNWNAVCYSGIGIASMVFYDDCEKQAVNHLTKAYNNMPIHFCNFTPDGAYAEGPGYWEYGVRYLTYFIKTSKQFLGTDFGLSQYAGVEEVGAFPVYISSPTGVFNYGDNKPNALYSPVLYYYANEFANPLTGHYQNAFADVLAKELSERRTQTQDMRELLHSVREPAREAALSALWYYVSSEEADFSALPKSVHLESSAGEELFIMRSAYLDENATYAAIKGGYNYTNHGDLDIGTFVFDALGVRWAEENGPGHYDTPGYFVPTYGGGRWKVYEKRAEGQNTLVINPKEGEDQFAFARCPITETCVTLSGDPGTATKEGGEAVIDMTRAYLESDVERVVRTFRLHEDYTVLTVKDEVQCKEESDIFWFMHTKADIVISPDSKTATLTRDGKQCIAKCLQDGTFSVMNAESLVYPDYEYNKQLDLKKLTVTAENVQSAVIEVELSPVY